MRSLAFLLLMTGTAAAAPIAQIAADVDGDGSQDKLELDATGELRIATKKGSEKVAVGAVPKATLAAALVKGTPTVLVQTDNEVIVLQRAGGAWKQLLRTPIGPVGPDADYSLALDARPEGIYRYQTRPGAKRCDGQPLYLFAEGFNGKKFQRLSKLPTGLPDNAPAIPAKPDTSTPAEPLVYRARFASHQPGAMDAGTLAIPTELDDGKPDTAWREDLTASAGEGQYFTYMPRTASARAKRLRIVTSNAKGNNRIQRLGVVGTSAALHIDVPDGAPGNAFVADFPQPIEGCVTIVIESTYGAKDGTTSIGELAVFADNDGDAALAQAVAEGSDGAKAAAQELARRGASAAAAIEVELAKAKDQAARVRLLRVAIDMHDAAAAPLLAKAVTDGDLQGSELVAALDALAGFGQANVLQGVAAKGGVPLAARVAAVHALRPANQQDRDVLVALAGRGPRELRQATIEELTKVNVATLAPLAVAQTKPSAAGDLWRAITRRAHAQPAERAPALTAMVAALPDASDYERRYRLIDGIAAIGDAQALKSLATLFPKLADGAETAAFKHVAARAIAVNPRPDALELLISLVGDHDAGVRLAALSALAGSSGGSEGPWHGAVGVDGIDRVIQTALYTDTWPEVRRFAAQVLGGRCSRPGPAAALTDSFSRDRDVGVRSDDLAALVQCKAAGIAALLAKVWDDGKAPLDLRKLAVNLTVPLEDAALAGKLVGKLTQWRGAAIESEQALALTQNAAYAIGRLAPPGAADALIAALDDSAFPEIVAAAATGLGLLGAKCPAAAKPKLAALANSDEQQVQIAAAHAVALCGK
ncbi:MAG TPA: HEAT repeat domain-containing protein [Kofleriaceae bacterium]|nr:HEAT repeat domain-containing protein [Kofleriaceae bacterium]